MSDLKSLKTSEIKRKKRTVEGRKDETERKEKASEVKKTDGSYLLRAALLKNSRLPFVSFPSSGLFKKDLLDG